MATGALGIADASAALIIDLYKNLNIERSADSDAIRRAYRKLALKYTEGQATFIIRNSEKLRAIYDQYGTDGLRNGVPAREGFEGFPGGYYYHGQPLETFSEFFGSKNPFADFFAVHNEDACAVSNAARPPSGANRPPSSASSGGGDGRASKMSDGASAAYPQKFGTKFGGMYGMNTRNPASSAPVQDPPVEMELPVTLEELYIGCVKKVKVVRKVLTDDGVTTSDVEKIFTIDVQRGWKNGTRVLFPREGDQNVNKIPADIVFVVKELPHSRFKREGNDLILKSSMTLAQALAGSVVEVLTLDERLLQIPINDIVHPDYVKAVSKEGMPIAKSNERGKLLLKFHITFPTFLNSDQKRAIKANLPQ
ncbi:DnaJ sub B member 13 [Entophlyctis sp. JEL0112]|nr:DnaJ sub B member 13 [Entophlyctis sp. JEL0112]